MKKLTLESIVVILMILILISVFLSEQISEEKLDLEYNDCIAEFNNSAISAREQAEICESRLEDKYGIDL